MLISSSVLESFSPGGIIFWCHIFLPFHIVHGIPEARTLEWFAIPSSGEPGFIRTFYCDSSIWVALHGMTHSFIELCKPLLHDKTVIHEATKLLLVSLIPIITVNIVCILVIAKYLQLLYLIFVAILEEGVITTVNEQTGKLR